MGLIKRSEQDLQAAQEWLDGARDAYEQSGFSEPATDAAISLAYSNLVIAGALGHLADLLDRQVNGA